MDSRVEARRPVYVGDYYYYNNTEICFPPRSGGIVVPSVHVMDDQAFVSPLSDDAVVPHKHVEHDHIITQFIILYLSTLHCRLPIRPHNIMIKICHVYEINVFIIYNKWC